MGTSTIESEGIDLGVGDFSLLTEITMEKFVENLKIRFEKGRIYTSIGDVLVSVNPYRELPLYRPEYIKIYKDCSRFQRPAHLFSLVETAYQHLRDQFRSSSIILTGEIGSGKSEALKIILRYLIARTNCSCSDLLIQTNFILDYFGNSRTNLNSNSSRFGKYFYLNLTEQGNLIGGNLQTYFLEKSRIVKQNIGERNFHCFYGFLASKQEHRETYGLNLSIKDYYYLNQGSYHEQGDDEKIYEKIIEGLNRIEMNENESSIVWKILATILHLKRFHLVSSKGNLVFVDVNGQQCSIKDINYELEWISKCLECEPNDLSVALLSQEIIMQNECIQTRQHIIRANFARDMLSKALYERLFNWLVQYSNRILNNSNENLLHIGIVDFSGFENLEINSFEQLCINYANEKLQQLFVKFNLKQEQEEYENENLTWKNIEYFNNKIICDLIEQTRIGLFSILDDNCQLTGTNNDEILLNSLNKTFQNHSYYSSWNLSPKNSIWKTMNNNNKVFLIRHYAGDVIYSIDEFRDKNHVFLVDHFKRLLSRSKNPLISSMWSDLDKSNTEKSLTTASRFRNSMINLVDRLSTQQTFFIRCIKPNHQKAENIFDQGLIEQQIASLNLLELASIRRTGFSSRFTYDQFVQRYKIIDEVRLKLHPYGPFDKESARYLCKTLRLKTADVIYGKTKIFFKQSNQIDQLEKKRKESLEKFVFILQKYLKSWRQFRIYSRDISTRKIQKFYRQYRIRVYIVRLSTIFKNHQGKNILWPESKLYFDKIFYQLYRQWRLKKIKEHLPDIQSSSFDIKLLASKYLQQRLSFFDQSIHQQWIGDYLSLPEENLRFSDYQKSMNELRKKDNFHQILFSIFAIKLNSRMKIDERAIILTDKYIYKCDLRKNFQIKKNDISIDDILGLSTTSDDEQLIVLHLISEHDLIFYMDTKVDRVGEFVGYIVKLKENSENFFVHVQSTIEVNVGKQKYMIDVIKDEINKAEFRKMSNTNISLILPKIADENVF